MTGVLQTKTRKVPTQNQTQEDQTIKTGRSTKYISYCQQYRTAAASTKRETGGYFGRKRGHMIMRTSRCVDIAGLNLTYKNDHSEPPSAIIHIQLQLQELTA